VLKIVLSAKPGFWGAYASSVASLVNAFQIQFMNIVYGQLAVWLTDRENHRCVQPRCVCSTPILINRTDTHYEDSLIAKLFAFQFVNSYASFFYVAFIKKFTEGSCDADNCMNELATALGKTPP
jgi:hypothetical protein